VNTVCGSSPRAECIGRSRLPSETRAPLDGPLTNSDKAFYDGKVAVAQFFARNVLPEPAATRTILSNLDNDIMELDEAAF